MPFILSKRANDKGRVGREPEWELGPSWSSRRGGDAQAAPQFWGCSPVFGLFPSFGVAPPFWGCSPVLGLPPSLGLLPSFGVAPQFWNCSPVWGCSSFWGCFPVLGLLPSFGVPQGQSGGAPCLARLPEAYFVLLGGSSNFLCLFFLRRFWIRGEGGKKSKNFGEGRWVRGAWAEQRHGKRKGVDFGGENTGLLSCPSSWQHFAHNLSQKNLLPEKTYAGKSRSPPPPSALGFVLAEAGKTHRELIPHSH